MYLSHSWDFIRLETLCKMQGVERLVATNATKWSGYRDFILNTIQPCNEMLLICQYGSVLENCSNIFETIATDQGACCSFNVLHPDFIYTGERWSLWKK